MRAQCVCLCRGGRGNSAHLMRGRELLALEENPKSRKNRISHERLFSAACKRSWGSRSLVRSAPRTKNLGVLGTYCAQGEPSMGPHFSETNVSRCYWGQEG